MHVKNFRTRKTFYRPIENLTSKFYDMEKEITITFNLAQIRAILENLAVAEWELFQLNNEKVKNVRAATDIFRFTNEEWDIILKRCK